MEFRIHPLVGVLIALLVIASVFSWVLFRPQISSTVRENIPVLESGLVNNEKYALRNPAGEKYPLVVEEGIGKGLAISGWLQEESLMDNGSIVVAIPSSQGRGSLRVTAYLPDGAEYLGVMKLTNGDFPLIQTWEAVPIEDVPPLLKQGMQVVLHFNTLEEQTQQRVNDFQNNKGPREIELYSLDKIVVGVFD